MTLVMAEIIISLVPYFLMGQELPLIGMTMQGV